MTAGAADAAAGPVAGGAIAALLAERGFRGQLADVVAVAQATAGGVPVGGLGPPEAERIRLAPELTLAFPTAEIATVGERDGRWRIEASCFGLYGPSSPLPTFVTERLLHDDERRSTRVRDFLDIFNHRLLSLLVRALAKHRPLGGDAAIAVLAAAGGAAPGEQMLASVLARRPGSAAGMQAALSAMLPGVAVQVEPCVPAWEELPPSARARLGSPMGGALGERMRACAIAFRLHLGPVDAAGLDALLPDGAWHARLRSVVAAFNPSGLVCLVRIATRPGAMPATRLGAGGALGRSTRCAGDDPGQIIDFRLNPAA